MTLLLALMILPLFVAPWMLLRPSKSVCVSILLAVSLLHLFLCLTATSSLFEESQFLLSWNLPLFIGERYFVYDVTSALFLNLTSIVFAGIAIYIVHRVSSYEEAAKRIHVFVALSLTALSLLTMSILSQHLLLTWVLIEASTLVLTPLICYYPQESTVKASWRYLLFSSIALTLVYIGFLCISLAMKGYSTERSEYLFLDTLPQILNHQDHPALRMGIFFIILGYGSKLGLAPFFAWLPETYDEAPPAVTALLASVQFNCVFLALFRLVEIFQPTYEQMMFYQFVSMGLVSMGIACIYIVHTDNFKKLIAYTSIVHVGVVSIGLGMGKNAIYGVILYVFSNAIIKAILFLTAANIKVHYATKNIKGIRSLLQEMPFSGSFFMFGIFALLGFAPFGSFMGEMLIMSSMIKGGHYIVFTLFCVLLTITFIAMGRAIFPMIWGESLPARTFKGETFASILPNAIFFLLLLAMGIFLGEHLNVLFLQVADKI